MAEYGDPDTDDWEFLQKYSPYHSTFVPVLSPSQHELPLTVSFADVDPSANYPPMLVTTSTRDDRVHPGHARKFVKVRVFHVIALLEIAWTS